MRQLTNAQLKQMAKYDLFILAAYDVMLPAVVEVSHTTISRLIEKYEYGIITGNSTIDVPDQGGKALLISDKNTLSMVLVLKKLISFDIYGITNYIKANPLKYNNFSRGERFTAIYHEKAGRLATNAGLPCFKNYNRDVSEEHDA